MHTSHQQLLSSQDRITMNSIIRAARQIVPGEYRNAPWAHPELDHGLGVLQSEDALNCYLAAYGKMHERKMKHLLMQLPAEALTNDFEIVDWGCGQGLATICLMDLIEQAGLAIVPSRVTLIDASATALCRAGWLVRSKLGPSVELCIMHTELPSFRNETCSHLCLHGDRVVLHLLSNVLDVYGLNTSALARAIVDSGEVSYVACASHYWTPIYSLPFSLQFRRFDMEPIFDYASPCAGRLDNGHPFSCDLRLFRCCRAA